MKSQSDKIIDIVKTHEKGYMYQKIVEPILDGKLKFARQTE